MRLLAGSPPVRRRIIELLRWRLVLRDGTEEEKAALVASLSEQELEIAASTLDVSDERVEAWLRSAMRDCLRYLGPFDAPV
jgi:hypothetical protein